ncbi:Alpha crystallin/Heat shock protein,HSP20-like chaperone,Alpha crystallin/Hsp20 domain [Cinara cedri]|uniref:Alpha crystallin/Heat shock protein,HSP20-like chaperone,Alpha crystallin/Hsp20 domain n=1 Tax=Cinara cedri TaxID=506608 RepID=A0A5E4M2N7_9HEMI|nr:Alpha crystallin/Heat shock protein,HSP20-like chaperone,Alpha crystallin/Hsp20 domain [Cinara cedri]
MTVQKYQYIQRTDRYIVAIPRIQILEYSDFGATLENILLAMCTPTTVPTRRQSIFAKSKLFDKAIENLCCHPIRIDSEKDVSLLPFLLEDLSHPTVYDQDFGLELLDDILVPTEYSSHFGRNPFGLRGYQRPMRLVAAPKSGLSRIRNDKDVKVIDDYIIVDGKHEERSDEHGFISRQFTRRYKIPDTVDPKSITSSLSSDVVLSIGAPKKVVNNKKEISIPIIKTNEPSIKVSSSKENKAEEIVDTK